MTEQLNTGSHDLPVTDELAAFMRTGWADTRRTTWPRCRSPPWAAKRRAALAARFPGERLVVPSGTLKVRSNDSDYRFRPHSALRLPDRARASRDDVLVIEPSGEARLYVQAALAARGAAQEFYRDRRYGEFWVGRRPDLAEAAAALPDRVRAPRASWRRADGPGAGAARGGRRRWTRSGRAGATATPSWRRFLSEMRLIKDEWEVARAAAGRRRDRARLRGRRPRAAARRSAHPRGERYVEGVFGLRSRLEGNAVGYDTIVASGAHACVLHWIRNDGRARPRATCCCWTRASRPTPSTPPTSPARCRCRAASARCSGRCTSWSTRRRTAAIAALRPGARFRDFHQAAMRVIAEGLHDWGLLRTQRGQR